MYISFDQRGYGGLGMFFAGVVVAAIALVYFYPTKFPKSLNTSGDTVCMYDRPLQTDSFTLGGVTYDLVSPARAMQEDLAIGTQAEMTTTYGNARGHLKRLDEKIQDVNGKQRVVYKPGERFDALGIPQTSTYKITDADAPEALKLRFVDVTDDTEAAVPGMRYFKVYLKRDEPIPPFIRGYCENDDLPKNPLFVFQDTLGNSFPPFSIPGKDWRFPGCTEGNCGDKIRRLFGNTRYYLFVYDVEGTTSYAETIYVGEGRLPGTVVIEGKTYPVVLVYASDIAYISILDNESTPKRSYKYVSEEYIHSNKDRLAQNPGGREEQRFVEQLDDFYPFVVSPWGWWMPECKPAVYLYPEKDTVVNVKVAIQNGFLTYTDPLYPKTGWSVIAKPSGELRYLAGSLADSKGTINYPTGIFPYLYYEGKVADSAVEKPQTGFVKKYEDLGGFYDELLPKLGLNATEANEFKSYWLKALPKAPYYFIGVLSQDQLNQQEPLTITPQEDTMIRVRLYFEALDTAQSVKAPEIQRPERNGFTVVDWGGMVKQDKAHPFTCLQ